MTPGIVFELLRERRRPGYSETVFREVSRVAATSTLFSGLSLLLLLGVRAVRPDWFPDTARAAGEGAAQYLATQDTAIALLTIAEVALACGLAWLAFLVTAPQGKVNPHSLLWNVLHCTAESPTAVPIATIKLDDGTLYMGYVAGTEWGVSVAEQDIALREPMSMVRSGTSEAVELPAAYKRVVLPMRRVQEMWIGFGEESDGVAAG